MSVRTLLGLLLTAAIAGLPMSAEVAADEPSNPQGRQIAGLDSRPGEAADPDPGSAVDDEGIQRAYFESLAKASGATIEQAKERTALQTSARSLAAELSKKHGDVYAGQWIDAAPPFDLHVAFTEDEVLKVLEEAYAVTGFPYSDRVRVERAQFSYEQLVRVYDSVAGSVSDAGFEVTGARLAVWIDVIGNVVGVRSPDAAVKSAAESAGPPGSVRFEVGPVSLEDHVNIRGGQKTRDISCTTGFVVRKNSSIEAGIVTAAHCGPPVYEPPVGLDGYSQPKFGPVLKTWSGTDDPDIDAMWLGLAEKDWVPSNTIVYNASGSTASITARTSYTSVQTSDYVCQYGWKTGNSCGYVQSTTCCMSGHRFIEVGSTMQSDYGDSGAPVYEIVYVPPYSYNTSAVGVHKGSLGDDPIFGSITFFEQDFHVTVATSSIPTPAYVWYLADTNSGGTATTEWEWAESGSIRVAGEWMSNDGRYQPGFFKNGLWDLEGMQPFYYGISTDKPMVGDWDGNGIDEVGVFRPSTMTFYRRFSSSIVWGASNGLPIAGDWDGDGDDDIGYFSPTEVKFYLRNGNGSVTSFYYGDYYDVPVTGDWDDDGVDEVGVFRPSTGQWFLQGYSGFWYGNAGDTPLPGDWSGDGRDTVGVTR